MRVGTSEGGGAVLSRKPSASSRLIQRTILKGHAPYTLGAGERACLLVHGIAGSPAQMRTLAENLAAEGFRSRGPLLPGHGTHPDDLTGIVWQDWYEAIHEEYTALKRECEEAYLIGFSIGAALSAHYAAHNPVDRLVLLSVPLCPLNDRFPTSLMLRIYSLFFPEVKGRAEMLIDADGEPFSYVYDRIPTSILYTMEELVGIARRNLNKIRSPILIVHSKNDIVSGSKSGPLVYRKVSSTDKHLVMLEKSGHSVMMDAEQRRVFEEVQKFLDGSQLLK